jgi:hypothetical protein
MAHTSRLMLGESVGNGVCAPMCVQDAVQASVVVDSQHEQVEVAVEGKLKHNSQELEDWGEKSTFFFVKGALEALGAMDLPYTDEEVVFICSLCSFGPQDYRAARPLTSTICSPTVLRIEEPRPCIPTDIIWRF